MLNAYTTEFFAACPNNSIRIKYRLRIETRALLLVEDILITVGEIEEGYHEEIADQLRDRFGGVQTLTAEHHGVLIETTRCDAGRLLDGVEHNGGPAGTRP